MPEPIPIFPIDVVLYPNQNVPLKIFEPRYRQMLDDCMSSNRVFGINILDGQKTESGWACPVKTGTLVYIVKCEDLDLTGSNYYIEILGKKRFIIDELISPSIERPAEYFPPDMPSMQTMMQKSSGEALYFQANVTYLDEIQDDVNLKDWNFMLGKLELRIIEIASNMGIEFENFTEFNTHCNFSCWYLINLLYSFVSVLIVFNTFGLISFSIAASVGLNSSSELS